MANEDIDFNTVSDETPAEEKELTANDFKGNGAFLKNPEVGKEITFEVVCIKQNKEVKFKNKLTGKEFTVGLQQKDKTIKRYDIHTKTGVYTIANWEIFFKLLGNEGVLTKYAAKHDGKYTGAKINVKKILDGAHANYKTADMAKILNTTEEKAQEYIDSIKLAIKESRLYEVKMVE